MKLIVALIVIHKTSHIKLKMCIRQIGSTPNVDMINQVYLSTTSVHMHFAANHENFYFIAELAVVLSAFNNNTQYIIPPDTYS